MDDKIIEIHALLKKVSDYNRLVIGNSFEPATVTDMKGKAKADCDDVKSIVDDIKTFIDQWDTP